VEQAAVFLDHAGIVLRIRDLEGFTARGHAPAEALADLEPGLAHHLFRIAVRAGQHQIIAFDEANPNGDRAEQTPACLCDGRQQRRDRLNARELARQLEQRFQAGLARLQLFDEPRIGEADSSLTADPVHQPEFGRHEAMLPLEPRDEEPSDGLVVDDHGAEETRSLGEPLEYLPADTWIGRDVGRGNRLPLRRPWCSTSRRRMS
jgi:hypothetical protein